MSEWGRGKDEEGKEGGMRKEGMGGMSDGGRRRRGSDDDGGEG